ncbi:MAG: ATP-binding protein [Bacteroidales bacterium]|nr:ATP-binding protein [Bacteroidales bacterium]
MRTRNIFIFFVVLLLLKGALAQPGLKIIGRITAADGLLTDGIKYTYKDSEGFMWFSYSNGFNRWDGHEVRNFPNYMSDTNLNSSYRYCRPILEDHNGNFFIGTLKNGLLKLDRKTGNYVNYVHDPKNPHSIGSDGIQEMILDDSGFIWIATFVKGISRFNPVTDTFDNYMVNPAVSYPWDCNNVMSICKDSRGIFWVGTSKGLFQFDEVEEVFTKIDVKPAIPEYLNSWSSILEDKNGNMWFGTNWGMFNFNRETGEWKHIETLDPKKANPDADSYINSIVEFHDHHSHQIWIASEAGLKVYDLLSGVLTHITPQNGYPDITGIGSARYLYIDESNILWASIGGMTMIDLNPPSFQIHEMRAFPDTHSYTQAISFYKDQSGLLWVGSQGDGLYCFDQELKFMASYQPCKWDPKHNNAAYNNSVSQIIEDRNNHFWVLTGPTGLCLFDKQKGEFKIMNIDVGTYITHEICIDAYDQIWVGAHNGLFRGEMSKDDDLKVTLFYNPSLPKIPVDNMLSDSHKRFWVLTRSSGVYCLTPENRDSMIFKRYLHDNYRRRFTIEYNARSMIEDDMGDIWFRSERGLYKYDPERDSIVPVDHFNRHYQQWNFGFARDMNGIFWFVTGYGLLQFNPFDTSANSIRILGHGSGIQNISLTRNDFFIDNKGYLYQGGSSNNVSGFFHFHPDSIRGPDTIGPPLVLTKFSVKNQPFRMDTSITYQKYIELKYHQNFFSFEFSALNYIGPERNQYAYMLEGFDDDWVYAGNRRFANYTGVPPGNYVFRVKCSRNDGSWKEDDTSVYLSILNPPWKTWWADTLYAFFAVVVLGSIIWYYLKRQQLRHALEIEYLQKEKLAELDRMKSRFFANISHEFRTPLTLILGPLEKLISTTNDKDCINDLNMMQRNARRLQRLINQLLNLSKLEAGEMKLIAGEKNIVGLVRGYVHSFESLAKQKNIRLKFTSDDEKTLIYVDNDKIEKILYNLLSNAFKFTPEGGEISVSVLTHPVKPFYREGEDDGVKIIVTDTGPGIPPDKVKHVFERFYQADNASSGDMEGTGIGLALTQELVKLHGGAIEVESKEGQGTRFIITLPKGYEHLKPDEIAPMEVGESEIGDFMPVWMEGDGSKPKEIGEKDKLSGKPILLVVEDNNDLRAYMRSFLDKEYIIYEAIDGERGLEAALENIPDLIISDVMMPRMDGYDLCRRLKTDERTSHIPIIMLTAKASREDKLAGLGLGADDFLTKPFDPAELQARIKNLINQRIALREKYAHDFKLSPPAVDKGPLSLDQQFLHKAIDVVRKYYHDPEFTVETFGSHMAMSRMQLHRKITALTGQAASEFIRSLRLQEAATLLKNKAGTIAEIAYDTGFTSPSYFTGCFKKYYGMSPTEYQRNANT